MIYSNMLVRTPVVEAPPILCLLPPIRKLKNIDTRKGCNQFLIKRKLLKLR